MIDVSTYGETLHMSTPDVPSSGDANNMLQLLPVCVCLCWLCWLQWRLFPVYAGFRVQGFVGGFLYVTCVSVGFKVKFVFKIVVSFESTGCYHDDNTQYSYLFQHNGA